MPKVSLKAHALVALVLVLLATAAYAPILNLSFLSDDWAIIRLLFALPEGSTDWSPVLKHFYSPSFGQALYRPLYSISFGLDYLLYGTNPLGYHFTNLVLHLVSSFFVYLVALELVPGERKREIAVTAGVIFALYPVHPEAVTWVAGRVDVVCAVFLLPSLFFFLRWLRAGRGLYLVSSLAFFVLALMSKETAMVLPVLLFLCGIYQRRSFAAAALSVAPFAVALGVYLLFRFYLLSGLEPIVAYGLELNIERIFLGFLYRTAHMFSPINLDLLPAGWQSFIEALFLFLPIPVIIALAVAYYRGWVVEKLPILLLALYAVALVPVAKALRPDPLLTTSRWFYIPSVFLSILIAYVLWSAFAGRARWALISASVVCAAFFAILVANNGPWLRAGEMTEGYLESGEEPDYYPLLYKGAYVFGNELTWESANDPLFDERSRSSG